MAKYQIFTDSSSDLSKEQRKEYGIEYFRMIISVKDKEYHADLDYEEYTNEQFYKWVGDLSNHCKTSFILILLYSYQSAYTYVFPPLLEPTAI